jgi:hypothetical protein
MQERKCQDVRNNNNILKPAQYPVVAIETSDAVAKNMEIFWWTVERDKCSVRVVLGEEIHKKW